MLARVCDVAWRLDRLAERDARIAELEVRLPRNEPTLDPRDSAAYHNTYEQYMRLIHPLGGGTSDEGKTRPAVRVHPARPPNAIAPFSR